MLADQFILRDLDAEQKPKIRMLTINPQVRIDTPVEKATIAGKSSASTWASMIYFNQGLFDFHKWRNQEQPETNVQKKVMESALGTFGDGQDGGFLHI